MKTFNRNVKFKISLSTGETIYEGKPPYELIEGELSPWLRLQEYLREKGAEITSLTLYTDNGQTWNLPTMGKNPKFKAFSDLEKPKQLIYKRIMAKDIEPGAKEDHYVIAVAVYQHYELQIWVNEKSPDHSWSIVKETE